MDHAAFVREGQRRKRLQGVADGPGGVHGPVAEGLFQADAIHQLQNHDQAAADAQGGAERGDVGVLQAGVELDFAEKAIGEGGIFVQIGEHDFHRLLAVGEQAAHAEDFAHAAAAQNSGHLVIAENIADLDRHGVA